MSQQITKTRVNIGRKVKMCSLCPSCCIRWTNYHQLLLGLSLDKSHEFILRQREPQMALTCGGRRPLERKSSWWEAGDKHLQQVSMEGMLSFNPHQSQTIHRFSRPVRNIFLLQPYHHCLWHTGCESKTRGYSSSGFHHRGTLELEFDFKSYQQFLYQRSLLVSYVRILLWYHVFKSKPYNGPQRCRKFNSWEVRCASVELFSAQLLNLLTWARKLSTVLTS